jgi:hypothetical protein
MASDGEKTMTKFTVHGPFVIPMYKGPGGRTITARQGLEFFQSHKTLASAKGCYVFGMRAGGGITPVYVGKATKGFGKECFTSHKLQKYQQCLVDYGKGTPVLFFVVAPPRRGALNTKCVTEIERFLIQTAVAANEDLLNVQGTAAAEWAIKGVLRSGVGRPSRAATLMRRMMDL